MRFEDRGSEGQMNGVFKKQAGGEIEAGEGAEDAKPERCDCQVMSYRPAAAACLYKDFDNLVNERNTEVRG